MSPESNSATIVGVIVGAVSFIAGAIAAVFGSGQKIAKFEHSLTRSHERHEEHEKKLSAILTMFTREDGEPRFVTSILCGMERASCHSFSAERFEKLEGDIKEMKTAQSENFKELIKEIRSLK